MTTTLHDLELPPPFRLAVLREAGDAFGYASARAAELGAGTLVFVGRFDVAEFAVVLEPEEPLIEARRSFYAGMTALADALAALAPPEASIAIGWPDALEIGRRQVGGGRLGWPPATGEDAVPQWLVFGAAIRLAWVRRDTAQPHSRSTALADAGFAQVGAGDLAEAFARYFLRAIDRWQTGEFAVVARDYLTRLRPVEGARHTIDRRGDLRVAIGDRPPVCRDLRAALGVPSWLDPATGEIA